MSNYLPLTGDRVRVTQSYEGTVNAPDAFKRWFEVTTDDGTTHSFDWTDLTEEGEDAFHFEKIEPPEPPEPPLPTTPGSVIRSTTLGTRYMLLRWDGQWTGADRSGTATVYPRDLLDRYEVIFDAGKTS